MQSRLRKRARELGGEADILNDERIRAGTIRLPSALERLVDLARENGGVQRDVHFCAT